MSAHNRFGDEFKKDAVSQAVDRGYPVAEVAERLGVSTKSICTWTAQFSKPEKIRDTEAELSAELRKVKKELARVTGERGIPKKATAYFARASR